MTKRILHFWQTDDPDSYELKVRATGADLDQVKELLTRRLFKITEQPDSVTGIFTGEYLTTVNKLRELEREGYECLCNCKPKSRSF